MNQPIDQPDHPMKKAKPTIKLADVENEFGTELVRSKSKVLFESVKSIRPRPFFTNLIKQSKNLIRRQDIYGHPVTLNYKGEDTYKTCPGGCLSIILLLFLFCYFALKLKYMLYRQEW